MRRRAAMACLVAIGLAASASGAVGGDRVWLTEVRSEALGRTMPVAVVRPERGNVTDKRMPVLVLLHGRGRNHRSLLDSPQARSALLAAPFYVVLPQGEDGWYIDSPVSGAGRYASYLDDVMRWMDANVPAAREPSRRGIAGWSMGGFGAVQYAESRPGRFGFVASIIGLLDFPRPETLPEGQNYRVPVERFTSDPSEWERWNPLRRVEALRGGAVTLVLATRGFERTMNENFIAELEAKRIPARVHRLEGGHEFTLVERALPLVLADAADFFGPEFSHDERRN